MSTVKASDVAKLRKATGAGMMDCKKALVESGNDFDKAVEFIRKKGQAIANKRSDREATEGVALGKVTDDKKRGAIIVVNCETDFVAKNDDFVKFSFSILDKALEVNPKDLNELKELEIDGKKIADLVTEQTGIIGEKIDLSSYSKLEGEHLTSYIHSDRKLATLIALSKTIEDEQVARDVAMQVAAMSPVAVDKDNVPKEIVDKELEIGKEQAKQEGKPEHILEKIAMGKLNKFFKENTLLNQAFIKENKISVKQYLEQTDKDLTVTDFVRKSLKD